MPGEMSRYRGPEHDHTQELEEPEYVEFNEHDREIEAIGEGLKLARSLQTKIQAGVKDPQRQRAFLDLVAILDTQLQEERATIQDPKYQRQLRPADRQQFQRAYEYLNRTSQVIDAEAPEENSPTIQLDQAPKIAADQSAEQHSQNLEPRS